MTPVYYWAQAIALLGRRFTAAELELALTQLRRGCDVEGWTA